MKIFLSILFAVVISLSVITKANATTLTFDDISTVYSYESLTNYGGSWNGFYVMNARNFDYYNSGYQYGLISGNYVAFYIPGHNPYVTSSETITFNGAYLTAAWTRDLQVTLKGYNDDVELYSSTVTLSDREPRWFDFNFEGINKLTFDSTSHVVMDNFTYTYTEPTPAPEPSTMLLGLIGLGGAAIRRRKKTA